VLRGRRHVAPEDLQAMALPVLRHRILTNFTAEAEGVTPDDLIAKLAAEVPVYDRSPANG